MQLHKLGKTKARKDPRTLQLSNYVKVATIPDIPEEVSWITHVNHWPMYGNDSVGDCVAAAAGHHIQQWTNYAGNEICVSPQDVIKTYEDVGGYVPGDPSTDNGMNMLTYLKYWRKTGVGGHKIMAFVSVNPKDDLEVKAAIKLFGGVYTGFQLPNSAAGKDSWTVTDGGIYAPDGVPGSWGGHCVSIHAASPHSLTCVTWGSTLKMSPNFFKDYCDECYAILSKDWLDKTGLSPDHFNFGQLQVDLQEISKL